MEKVKIPVILTIHTSNRNADKRKKIEVSKYEMFFLPPGAGEETWRDDGRE